jgi:hypothetical protein
MYILYSTYVPTTGYHSFKRRVHDLSCKYREGTDPRQRNHNQQYNSGYIYTHTMILLLPLFQIIMHLEK